MLTVAIVGRFKWLSSGNLCVFIYGLIFIKLAEILAIFGVLRKYWVAYFLSIYV